MLDQQKISQRDDKYWIKPGVEVAHREFPDRKMIVDDVLKKTETLIEEGGTKKARTFVIGVECHWFGEDKRYLKAYHCVPVLVLHQLAYSGRIMR